MTTCLTCGKESNIEGQTFCPFCGTVLPTPQSQPKPLPPNTRTLGGSAAKGLGLLLLVCLGVGVLKQTFNPRADKQQSPNAVKDQHPQKLIDEIDPPASKPLTAQEHLRLARQLLAQVDVNGDFDRADALITATLKHAAEAKTDVRTKANAQEVMHRAAHLATDLLKVRAWNSELASITAEVDCKTFIERRLKSPASADWMSPTVGKWANHPGYFLVRQTVDAQNSFGAKLRDAYECQVLCISDSFCGVEKMYPLR